MTKLLVFCSCMSDTQGQSSHLWQTLKQTLSFGTSQDPSSEGNGKAPGGASPIGRLSPATVKDLPPLQTQNGTNASHLLTQNGTSASHLQRPSREHQRSSSWVRRFSGRRLSSERPASMESGRRSESATESLPQASSKAVPAVLDQNGRTSSSVDSPSQEISLRSDSDARRDFLDKYDAASLELFNRLSDSSASCMGDTACQEVAPWNRAPGHLVRHHCACTCQWKCCRSGVHGQTIGLHEQSFLATPGFQRSSVALEDLLFLPLN